MRAGSGAGSQEPGNAGSALGAALQVPRGSVQGDGRALRGEPDLKGKQACILNLCVVRREETVRYQGVGACAAQHKPFLMCVSQGTGTGALIRACANGCQRRLWDKL